MGDIAIILKKNEYAEMDYDIMYKILQNDLDQIKYFISKIKNEITII